MPNIGSGNRLLAAKSLFLTYGTLKNQPLATIESRRKESEGKKF